MSIEDPHTERRIERMLEVERELRDQYDEHHQQTDSEPDDEEEEIEEKPADSQLNKHTGRVLAFIKDEDPEPHLRLKVLHHTGETSWLTIPWPDDPTDTTEELVRLCAYLDVPIDRLANLHGAYVPLEKENDKWCVEIPPIPALGNNLVYGTKRRYRTTPALQLVGETLRLLLDVAIVAAILFSWIPAGYIVQALWLPGNVPELLVAGVCTVGGIISFVVFLAIAVEGTITGMEKLRKRLFPKPEEQI